MSIGPIEDAARALSHWQARHQAMSNNLANTGTSGFKAERVFGELLADRTLRTASRTDFGQGPLSETGAPLDVALVGDGFLVVRTDAGDRLTRGGSFELDPRGRLVDRHGFPLMGERGEIVLSPGDVEIARDGTVLIDRAPVGRLRVVRTAAQSELVHEGDNRFVAPEESVTTVRAGDRDVRQGTLEESNVGALEGMVEMISIQRAFAAVEKAVEALDGAVGTAIELGRPAR